MTQTEKIKSALNNLAVECAFGVIDREDLPRLVQQALEQIEEAVRPPTPKLVRLSEAPEYAVQYSDKYHFAGDLTAYKEATGLMTGQEWYDKFKAESTNSMSNGLPGQAWQLADNAAKKAAGLES